MKSKESIQELLFHILNVVFCYVLFGFGFSPDCNKVLLG